MQVIICQRHGDRFQVDLCMQNLHWRFVRFQHSIWSRAGGYWHCGPVNLWYTYHWSAWCWTIAGKVTLGQWNDRLV